jgi:hypothetical protein
MRYDDFVRKGDRVMSELLSITEMEARFPREWVLIGDPETDESHFVKAGTVLFHSKDRDETDRKALELHPGRCAIYYLGPIPEEGVELLLHAAVPMRLALGTGATTRR